MVFNGCLHKPGEPQSGVLMCLYILIETNRVQLHVFSIVQLAACTYTSMDGWIEIERSSTYVQSRPCVSFLY